MVQRFVLFAAVSLTAAGCLSEDVGDVVVTGAALDVQERSASEMVGSFAYAGSLVEFRGALEGGASATVHLDVNGLAFDIARDDATQMITHDGHNGMITVADREALTAMAAALRDEISLTQEMPRHEELLVRAVSYLAEAPAGYTLARRELRAPVAKVATERIIPAGTPITEEADETRAIIGYADGQGGVVTDLAELGDLAGVEANQACQQSNEDGILYLTGYSSVSKNTVWSRWQCHDTTSHCMLCYSTSAGPGTSSCKGECGPGCWGVGSYTYDCMDHDQCCREGYSCTDPWNSSCGDEYREADDDVLWARILWLY